MASPGSPVAFTAGRDALLRPPGADIPIRTTEGGMNATILLGTLKKSGISNTETLSEFLAGRMGRQGVQAEIVRLVDHQILPGTCSDMGEGDDCNFFNAVGLLIPPYATLSVL